VEARFDGDPVQADARVVLGELPSLRFTRSVGRYGWVWLSPLRPSPEPGDVIGLTVVGMSRISEGQAEAEMFISALGVLAKAERSFTPSPTEVKEVTVSSDQLRRSIFPPQVGYQPYLDRVARLGAMLRHEPSS
jgi:hypothetical protein